MAPAHISNRGSLRAPGPGHPVGAAWSVYEELELREAGTDGDFQQRRRPTAARTRRRGVRAAAALRSEATRMRAILGGIGRPLRSILYFTVV